MKSPDALLIALLAFLVAPALGQAQDTFRCGSELVSPGLSAEEVVAKCGQPDEKEVTEEPIRARNAGGGSRVIGTAIVEHWTYSRGQGQFPALLRIEEGELKSVELQERD